jgi:putative ABC transport system ATP-binding protein
MDTASAPPALLVEGLRKNFASTDDEQIPVRALRGLDVRVARGEFVAVMGPSGCGKSTLLNLVAGLETPTDGSISIDGEPIDGLSEDQLAVMRRRHIGVVFQFFNLLEGMSVRENVSLPMVVAGRSRKQADSRAMDLLDLLGIADKAPKTPGVLSGGQRQRLSIARALANEPTLLLADEPTGSLDSAGGTEILGLFQRLHDGGQTIVMVTHDDEVATKADRIVRMKDGRIDDGHPASLGAAGQGGVFGVLGETTGP